MATHFLSEGWPGMSVVVRWRPRLGREKAWPPEGDLCGSQCNQYGDPEGREEGGWEGSRVTSVQMWCPDSQKTIGRAWPLTGGRVGCEWGCKSKGWAVSERLGTVGGAVGGRGRGQLPCQHSATRKLPPGWLMSFLSLPPPRPALPLFPPFRLPSLPSSLPFFSIAKSDYANHGFSVPFLP